MPRVIPLLDALGRSSRRTLMVVGVAVLVIIGVVDYLTGFEILFAAFYLLEVGLATWFVGKGFGVVMSILSVLVWIGGDVAAGAHYARPFIVPIWNATILLVVYSSVVWILTSLRRLQSELESKVQQRTVALTQEMAERARLEKELVEVSEREQRRIGHDLHDSLCQHLTGTALAGHVLGEKLAARALPEAADANKVVELVEDGISIARNLARGISPVEIESQGLMSALRDLAGNISNVSKIVCVFECDPPVPMEDAGVGTQLYRIAQEATSNAIRHGKAKRVGISLSEHSGVVTLAIEDDGTGLPDGWQKSQGIGTRIMAHRAGMIGGDVAIEPSPTGGTLVRCRFPSHNRNKDERGER